MKSFAIAVDDICSEYKVFSDVDEKGTDRIIHRSNKLSEISDLDNRFKSQIEDIIDRKQKEKNDQLSSVNKSRSSEEPSAENDDKEVKSKYLGIESPAVGNSPKEAVDLLMPKQLGGDEFTPALTSTENDDKENKSKPAEKSLRNDDENTSNGDDKPVTKENTHYLGKVQVFSQDEHASVLGNGDKNTRTLEGDGVAPAQNEVGNDKALSHEQVTSTTETSVASQALQQENVFKLVEEDNNADQALSRDERGNAEMDDGRQTPMDIPVTSKLMASLAPAMENYKTLSKDEHTSGEGKDDQKNGKENDSENLKMAEQKLGKTLQSKETTPDAMDSPSSVKAADDTSHSVDNISGAPDKMNNGTKSSSEDVTFDSCLNEAVAE